MSVIDDIYSGRLYPAEQVKPDSPEFLERSLAAEKLYVSLEGVLDRERRGVLEEYRSAAATVTDLYNLAFFRAGVKLGVRLVLEALDAGAELPDIHK